jgi:hypothetical protein
MITIRLDDIDKRRDAASVERVMLAIAELVSEMELGGVRKIRVDGEIYGYVSRKD